MGGCRLPADSDAATHVTSNRNLNELPDGRPVAYPSDTAGEYALHLSGHMGPGEVRALELPCLFG